MILNSLKLVLILAIVKPFAAIPRAHVKLPRLIEPLKPSEDYTHSLVVDNDEPEQYHLYWKLVDNDEYLQFEVHCKTTGWAGFGLSPNGDMTGADIAIGWVDDATGKAYLRDTHADSRSRPIVDPIQDLHLIDAKQVSGYTMYKYKRALKTCDEENDIEIKKETNYLIFAWNDEDPVNDVWKPHGPNNRRIVVDMLLNFKDKNENMDELIEESENSNKLEFTLKNFTAKADGTLYYCQVFEYPPTPIDLHLIRYEVLISQGNKDIFHHLILYECDENIDFSNNPNEAHECGYVRPTPNIQRCLGSQIIAVWSVGGRVDYFFPSNAGYPITKTDKPKYYMIEFHFDYLKIDQPRLDNSGIRLYLTPNLRKDDIGVLTFGAGSSPWDLQMPPQINDIMFTSACYPECFDQFLPDDGIYVFSGLLHTHLAGRSVKTKLVRNNKIITNLYENPKYDFNYQFTVDLDPIKLYKGDSLIIECRYNTMGRDQMTFWGFSTNEEMCYSFVYFYPKMPKFRVCYSTPSAIELQNFYNSLRNDGLLPEYVTSNQTDSFYYMLEMSEKLKLMSGNEFSDELRKRYIDFYGKPNEHSIVCGSDAYIEDAIFNVEKPFPTPENAIEVIDTVCKEGISVDATSTAKPATTTKVVIKETTSAATMNVFDRFIMLLGALVVAFNFL